MIEKNIFLEKVDNKIINPRKDAWRTLAKKDLLKSLLIFSGAPVFIIIFCVLRFAIGIRFGYFTLPLIVVSVFFGFKYLFYKKRKRLESFKLGAINDMLDILLEGYDYNYNPYNCIPSGDFYRSPFNTGKYNIYKGEDFLSINIPNDNGTSSTIPFKISDLNVQNETVYYDSEGKSQTTILQIYKGALGCVDFPFEFKCSISIYTRQPSPIFKNVRPAILKPLETTGPTLRAPKEVTTEDIEFNNNFQLYTNDEVEALVILTPQMITKLKKLNKMAPDFEIHLFSSKLYISFKKLDLFEIDKKEKPYTAKMFGKVYDNVEMILSIIEEIKSNNKVFKM